MPTSVSLLFRADGGLERPPAGTIACPTEPATAHLGIAKAQRRPFRPPEASSARRDKLISARGWSMLN
jgi:hypothetical protein